MLVRAIPKAWIESRIGVDLSEGCETLGLVFEGVIVAGIAYVEYFPNIGSISMCLAIDDASKITKGVMRDVFVYPFLQLGVKRITNTCSINNRKAIAINKRAGFVQEGIMRKAYYDGSDMVVFGMLKSECKYL